jgi:hypothetical protein
MDRQTLTSSSSETPGPRGRRRQDGLSYKFQRLRERLREAVAKGELAGKLPGERTLARRFHVNAKTLSKALTDLAAEGLLDRSIGRGTYVKGANGANSETDNRTQRWMVVCDPQQLDLPVVQLFRQENADSAVVHDVRDLRPSFLKQFGAVIDFGLGTPDSFLRDMLVRNVPVVAVNREAGIYSVHSVGADYALGAAKLTRDLLLAGHRRLAVATSVQRSPVPATVRQTAARYAQDVAIDAVPVGEIVGAVRAGVTAVVCDSTVAGHAARRVLEAANVSIPDDVSLTAIGCCDAAYPCSGQFVDSAFLAKSIAELLKSGGAAGRPATLWLAPAWVDRGTTRVVPEGAVVTHPELREEAAA